MRQDPARIVRVLGAAALLGVGLDHLDALWAQHYDAIPTIGPLFALNVGSAAVVALALVLPLDRLGADLAWMARRLLAASGIGIAAGALAGLLISEQTSLFGFHESGYRATIVVAIAFEVATIVLLGAAIALDRRPAGAPGATAFAKSGRVGGEGADDPDDRVDHWGDEGHRPRARAAARAGRGTRARVRPRP